MKTLTYFFSILFFTPFAVFAGNTDTIELTTFSDAKADKGKRVNPFNLKDPFTIHRLRTILLYVNNKNELPSNTPQIFDKLIHPQPISNSSGIAFYFLGRTTSQNRKLVVTEIFASQTRKKQIQNTRH